LSGGTFVLTTTLLTFTDDPEPATAPGTVPVTPFVSDDELLVELPRK
jgi:hypothetical protein